MEVKFPNGKTDTIRLLRVDTPETSLGSVTPDEFEGIPDTVDGRDHLYEWGGKASSFATNQLEGQEVRIEVHEQADRRGSFGRLLVFVDGENFNKRLLTDEYARVYDSDFSERSAFAETEQQVQLLNEGLWDYSKPTTTTEQTTERTTTESSDIPPPPPDGDYDCSHFDPQEQAQTMLERSDGEPHRLDGDEDGIAFESL